MLEPAGTALILSVACVAAWCDARTRRIPNSLTVFALLAALLLVTLGGGPMMLLKAVGLGVLVLLLGLPLFAAGILGGGDLKLLIAFAAMLGVERILPAVILITVAGAGLALLEAARRGALIPVLYNCRDLITSWVVRGRGAPTRSYTPLTVPYGVAIGLGAVGAWML